MKFKRIISKILIFAMMLTFVPASYAKAVDTVRPQVIGGNISVDPIAGYSKDVDINIKPELIFSKDMDATTGSGLLNTYAVYLYEITATGLSSVNITKSYEATSKKLTISPLMPLKEGKAYKIALSQGYCKDTLGNSIEANTYMSYQMYFSTVNAATEDIIPPVIVAAYPKADSVKIPADLTATLAFNEDMDSSTINNTNIVVQTKSGWSYVNIATPFTVTYDAATKVATIKVQGNLSEFVDYQVHAKEKTIKDIAGNILEYRTFPFKTASSDVQSPKVISTSISDGAVEVDIAQKFRVAFDEALKYDTFSNFVEVKKDGVIVDITKFSPGTESSSGDKVLSIPGPYSSTKWDKGAVYTITIKPGLSDKFENKTTETYVYSFTTVTPDLVPPTITSMLPDMVASTEASPTVIDNLRPEINVEFSEKIPRYLVNGSYQSGAVLYEYKTDANGGWWTTLVNSSYSRAFTVTPDSIDPEPFTKMTVKPTIDLKENVKYKLEIKVADLQGNLIDVAKQQYFFTPKLNGGGETDIVPPTIISTYPEKKDYSNRPMDIAVDMKATVKFSEAMDETTLNSTNVYIGVSGTWPSQKVASTLSYDKATSTVTITPSIALNQLTEYVVVIKDVKDLAGNKLTAEYNVDFKTVKTDFVGPKVVSVYPAENATNVVIDKPFAITFDKAYKYDSTIFNENIIVKEGDIVIPVNQTFQDKGITFGIGASNKELRISRSVPGSSIWSKGKIYTITVKGGILDEVGNAMNTEKTWSFTTMEDDTTPPVIKSITPILSKSITAPTAGIGLRPSFTIIFSEPISTSSYGQYANVGLYNYLNNDITSNKSKVKDILNNNAWIISYDETDKENVKMVFTVTKDLKEGDTYTLSLPVQDLQYNYCTNADFHFIPSAAVVKVAPEVVSVAPVNYSAGVKIDVNPNIVFNTDMDVTSFAGNVKLMKSIGSFNYDTVESTINYDATSKTATIVPKVALDKNKEYKVSVDIFNVKSSDGIAGTKIFFGSTFTTENGDTEAPKVISTTPIGGSKDVDLKAKVSIKFSEELKANEDIINYPLKNYVSIYEGLNKIDVTPYINGVDKSIISIDSPTNGWKDGGVYTVKVLSGLGILDMGGNQLLEGIEFTFTCINNTLTALSVIETSPMNNAVNVALNQQITAKFNIKDVVAIDGSQTLKNSVILKEGNIIRSWDSLDVVNIPMFGDVLTIKLDRPLLANTEYTVTIKAGVRTYDQKSTLATDYSWKFNTGAGAQALVPTVESIKVTSGNGTVNLVDGAVDIPKDIDKVEILFNKLMKEDTIKKLSSEYIYITAKADKTQDYTMTSTVITTENGKTKVTLTGLFGKLTLDPLTKYYLVIPATVTDMEGIAIKSTIVGFTTDGTVIEDNKIVKLDVDNTIITSGTTVASAVEVNVNPKKITLLTEKDLMGPDDNANAVRLWEENGTITGKLVSGVTTTITGKVVTLDLSNATIKENTTYKVAVKGWLTALDGSELDKDYTFYFKPVAKVVLAPAVESIKIVSSKGTVDLVDGTKDVVKDIDKIEIQFNKLMNEDTIKKGYSEYIYLTANADKTQDYTFTKTVITTENAKTKATLSGFFGQLNLEPATNYYLVIPQTVKDTEGVPVTKTVVGFTTEGIVGENNKIVKVDVDNVIINSGITVVSPVEVNLNPKKITLLTEKELQGLDFNDGVVRLWEENGTTFGKLVAGVTTFISGKVVTLDLSNASIKENTVYRVQVKDYLEATDGALLDKEYIFYFKPVNKVIDVTKGIVSIEGNNIIKKDDESKLIIKTDVQKMSSMEFVLTYDVEQLSAVKAEVVEALKHKDITVTVEKNVNNLETGRIIFSAKFEGDIAVTDLMNVTFKSLKGEKSTIKFGTINYVKDNVPQIARGSELIVMGLTLDLNNDGKVSILDIIMVTRLIGLDSSSEEWELYKGRDINNDGKIDELDADIIARHLGEIVK